MRSPKRKQTTYLSDDVIAELNEEAARLDRPISWVIQLAWRMARERVQQVPSPTLEPSPEPPPEPRRRKARSRARG
jgi:uncharacterized small protein (TIGR04563 family)